jgi:hypothetical protein
MRYAGTALLALVLAALVAAPAAAANPHFVVGPTFTVAANNRVQATGEVAGLGNGDIDVTLTAELAADLICTNPAGNVAPGQTQAIRVTGTQTDIEVKNGRAAFDVTTAAPQLDPTKTPRQLGCPNNKWRASIANVTVLSATLVIEQGGEVVLRESLTP